MPTKITLLFILFLPTYLFPSAGETYTVYHLDCISSSAPTIDGDFSDDCWVNVGFMHNLVDVYGGALPDNNTCKIVFNDTSLYLALELPDLALSQYTGDAIWQDDGPEFFFDTIDSDQACYNLMFNKSGQWGDNYYDFDGGLIDRFYIAYGCEAIGNENGLEIKIPFSSLAYANAITLPTTTSTPINGEQWGFEWARTGENEGEYYYSWCAMPVTSRGWSIYYFNTITFSTGEAVEESSWGEIKVLFKP